MHDRRVVGLLADIYIYVHFHAYNGDKISPLVAATEFSCKQQTISKQSTRATSSSFASGGTYVGPREKNNSLMLRDWISSNCLTISIY